MFWEWKKKKVDPEHERKGRRLFREAKKYRLIPNGTSGYSISVKDYWDSETLEITYTVVDYVGCLAEARAWIKHRESPMIELD